MSSRVLASVVCLLVLTFTRRVSADDAEDLAWDLSRRARSQLDLTGFVRSPATSAPRELGFLAELALSWDSPPKPPARDVRSSSVEGATAGVVSLPVTPRVARQAVSAAIRTAKLLTDDDASNLAARARWSGLVPELRLRAARLWDESARAELSPSDTLRTSDAFRANLWLEARASFRLDRLVFADEELAAFRLRLEQSELAQRIALRVVAILAAWQRAWVEARSAPAGSVAALEASLRVSELEATLDVVTGGWFAGWRGREVR